MKVDNSSLIAAVDSLKASKIIKRDSEIAEKMKYSKGNISAYLNNKKTAPELFMIKFYEAYPEAKKGKQSSQGQAEEPTITYGKALDLYEETVQAQRGEIKLYEKYTANLEREIEQLRKEKGDKK